MINLKDYFRRKEKDQKAAGHAVEQKTKHSARHHDDSGEHGAERIDALKELAARISRHRMNQVMKISAVVLGLLLLAGGLFLYTSGKTFDDYQVVVTTRREDTTNTHYMEFQGKILKYSLDGVSYIDSENETLWNQTYGMQTPIVATSQSAVAIADQSGNDIYVFNSTGPLGRISTPLPIIKIKVANQGVVAALLEEGDTTWIYLYDARGEELVEYKTTLDDSGYPLDIALSPEGTKVVISYMKIDQGIVSTHVAFYNFDAVGRSFTGNLVNSAVYDYTVVPELHFLDNNTAAAFMDNGFAIFSGKQILEETQVVSFEEEIKSIFYNESYLGFVFAAGDEEHRYQMQIYDTSGKLVLEKGFNDDYHTITIEEDVIIIVNNTGCTIRNMKGTEIFRGDFAKTVHAVFKGKGFHRYTVVSTESIDQIKLR